MEGDGIDDTQGMHQYDGDGVKRTAKDYTGAGTGTGKYVLYVLVGLVLSIALTFLLI